MSSAVSTLPRHKLTGVCPPARAAVLTALMRRQPAPAWLVVVGEPRAAEQLAEDIAVFHALADMQGVGSPDTFNGGPSSREADSSSTGITASQELSPPHTSSTHDVVQGGPPPVVCVLPESMADSRDMREAFTASSDRLTVLSRLRDARGREAGILNPPSETLLVVTTPAALLQPVPAIEELRANEITLASGRRQPFQALLDQLRAFDYDSEAVCEAPGQYAVRGGIIDLYPVTATRPYRLDFFGDDIEDIRAFDPVTQRSGESVERITLSASPRLRLAPSPAGLADYIDPRTHLVFVEPAALEEAFSLLAPALSGLSVGREEESSARPAAAHSALEAILSRCAAAFGVSDLDEPSALFDGAGSGKNWNTGSLAHHRRYPDDAFVAHERLQFEEEARRDFLRQAAAWEREGYAVVFAVPHDGEEQRAREILRADPAWSGLSPRFLRGALNEGFLLIFQEPSAGSEPATVGLAPALLGQSADTRGLVLVTETEIFGRKRRRRDRPLRHSAAGAPSQVDQLLDFSEIVEGDHVVHLQHGIAQYRGLTKIETSDGRREVISLEFADQMTLHVPLQESHLISRYVGLAKARPQLGRIGANRWEKTRAAAERATLDLAAQLLDVQARRATRPGHAFAADTEWQREFEASFPHAETSGQLQTIAAVKKDMEQARPMDRLLCGDVGFGKTEVAVRAAFKAVMDGRQAAVLVPTTVLAQQHLNTFSERMAGYPVAIEMLSRFRSRVEQRRILAATAAGKIDVLIGTHRLLQRDVAFKDLGLVVIDEEQRFGVKHKEVFKQWRAHVDLLSMSATPIPRTLYLALTGARDLSVIETPPADRHPIQTNVRTYDENLVVEAIRHEVRRGGQVFYLHNRVQTIDSVARRLRELLPDLAIGVGHGRMDEGKLERVMTDFVAGRHHVLVCTTIIESGLDIPNCNTILIEGADRFGLAQLYQLRGRVGRFRHQAHAYLLLHRHTRLLDVARWRLNALRQHNQPGAGFRIAMRDLELRGAGNLLGPEQSGHIAGVGFELYCQLLRQSIARLKGDRTAALVRAAVKLDFVFVGEGEPATARPRHENGYTALREAERAADACPPIQARIPLDYIGETRLRLDFYRRLALAESPATLRAIETELRDRFGRFGDEVRALLLVTGIRLRAEQKGVLSVETEGTRLKCLRRSGKHDDFIMPGKRFPRLTASRPLLRLREIAVFLKNLPGP